MRRPVKPFVTEYRGGARRQGPPGQKTDPFKAEPESAEPRAAEARTPAWPQGAPPEDGYEAALRAADALFSGGRAPAAVDESPDHMEPSEAQPGAGRVLRVLDEPPSPEMERLEAEFAPKKRGRKPGSKNKPKSPAIAALAEDARVMPTSAISPQVSGVGEAPAVPGMATQAAVTQPEMTYPETARPATPRPAIPRPTSNAVPALSAGPSAPRGERYAWVRTRLKPGEQWKRRLPKVAW